MRAYTCADPGALPSSRSRPREIWTAGSVPCLWTGRGGRRATTGRQAGRQASRGIHSASGVIELHCSRHKGRGERDARAATPRIGRGEWRAEKDARKTESGRDHEGRRSTCAARAELMRPSRAQRISSAVPQISCPAANQKTEDGCSLIRHWLQRRHLCVQRRSAAAHASKRLCASIVPHARFRSPPPCPALHPRQACSW